VLACGCGAKIQRLGVHLELGVLLYIALKERSMKLKYAFIISTAILFLSAPAWGDSIKSNSIHVNQSWHSFGHSNVVTLGGFKSKSDKHESVFKFKEDHFVLVVKNDAPTTNDPVSTPEPGALSLLLVGLVAAGAFGFRRVPSLVGAR
jgi:hypothetical protein